MGMASPVSYIHDAHGYYQDLHILPSRRLPFFPTVFDLADPVSSERKQRFAADRTALTNADRVVLLCLFTLESFSSRRHPS